MATLPSTSRVEPADEADRWSAWDDFVEADPQGGFMQSSWWADFRVGAGYRHFAAVVRHRGAILGGALVTAFDFAPDRCFYYMPDGPMLPQDEGAAGQVLDAVLDVVEEHRRAEPLTVSHLRIEPRWTRLPDFVRDFRPLPERGDSYMEPRSTLYLDLGLAEADLLAQMKPKGRYNIGVARRHGVTVVEDASERGVADFLDIYDTTFVRQGLNSKPPDYFEELVDLLTYRQRGSIFFAEYKGERIATALVVYFGSRATYFYGGSLATHRNVMAPYLLHFEIMMRAKAMGLAWYDLWGIAPPDEADHPWQNFSVFKRKLGGVDVRLVPTLDRVYDSAAYDDYQEYVGGRRSRSA